MSFDQRASSWDTPERIERAALVAGEIRKTVPLRKEWNALEFGCGTGLIGFNLAGELAHLTMLDTAEGMIGEAARKADEGGFTNVETVNARIEELLGKQKFDFIFTSMALHHIPGTHGIAGIFRKLLNKKGVLCIVDLDTVSPAFHEHEAGFDGHHGFDQAELRGILEAEGFHSCASHTFLRAEKKSGSVAYSLFILKAEV